MRQTVFAAAALAAAAFAAPAWAEPMPMDNPVSIDGTETVCTGIGDEAQQDPRWKAYPVRIEFSNGGSQYLSGAHVTLKNAGGKTLADLDCAGAWVLFKLKPGSYKAAATLLYQQQGTTRSASFTAPASGQKRVVIQFPSAPNQ